MLTYRLPLVRSLGLGQLSSFVEAPHLRTFLQFTTTTLQSPLLPFEAQIVVSRMGFQCKRLNRVTTNTRPKVSLAGWITCTRQSTLVASQALTTPLTTKIYNWYQSRPRHGPRTPPRTQRSLPADCSCASRASSEITIQNLRHRCTLLDRAFRKE